ncbi:MAG: GDSL-type esterase/lipase family protein [Thermoguttaceae bacterium]|nr:GDSL-type esterase/lipase family protein [Thermoguttaceae bacterium]
MKTTRLLFVGLLLLFASSAFADETPKAAAVENPAIVPADHMDQGWWKERFELQCQRIKKGNVDLMMIGDSITHGWDRKADNYAVWDQFYGRRNALNFGIGGDRTEHVIWRLLNAPLDKISPKMAVVMIGTNNIGHKSSTAAQTVEGIKKIVSILKEKFPKMKILVLEVFPRGEKANDPMRLAVEEINAGLRKEIVNMENVELDSIGKYYLTADGTLPKDLMPDFLHPDAEGYLIWAKALEAKIMEGLGETPAVAVADNENRNNVKWLRQVFENEQIALDTGKCDLLFIGDSITNRWNLKTPRPPKFEYEHNGWSVWTGPLAKYNPVNLGIDGDRTQHVLWRLEKLDFSKVSPKMAVVLIGVNNTAADDFKAGEVAFGIRKICQKVHEKCPKAKIVVLKVYPITTLTLKNGDPRQPRVDALNDVMPYFLRDLNYVTIKDISRVFQEKDRTITKEIMPDRIHLSTEGYRRWAQALAPEFKQFLGTAL